MKILALSDMHGYLQDVKGQYDLIIIGGDMCPGNDHSVEFQSNWLADKFNPWLKSLPSDNVVCIAGNHDFIFERARPLVPKLKCHYLQDSKVEIDGVKIWGSPWSRKFFDWAFMGEEDKLSMVWDKILKDTDILVVHGPPFQAGDVVRGEYVGSTSLKWWIERNQPKLVICGHIHEAHGIYNIGDTIVANVSVLDGAYNPWIHNPMIFEFDSGKVKVLDDGTPGYGYGDHYSS
jgi:Icc-related predicted phosphoesterase